MKQTDEEVAQCNSQLPRLYSPAFTEKELLLVAGLLQIERIVRAGGFVEAIQLTKNIVILSDRGYLESAFQKLRALVALTEPPV